MNGRVVITGGRVIDPGRGFDGAADVLVEGGRVAAVERPGSFAATGDIGRRVEAAGCLVIPGLVDAHAHLREPGYEYKETIATGAAAAIAGGFTTVACMANTNPVNDSAAVTQYIRERAAAAGLARVRPVGAVSLGLGGERLAEIGEMREAGIVAVSDDGRPVMDGELMRRALEYTRQFAIPVISHAEDLTLAGEGVVHEGEVALRLGLAGAPSAAEEAMVARDIALAALTGGRLHIAHLSTRGAVELVRRAKADGVQVTAEVTPHHLALTEEAIIGYATHAKVRPPLRTAADREALREGLRDGTIDAVATDHAPHHRDEKEVEFEAAAYGATGLETALSLVLRLVEEGVLTLAAAVARLTLGPARSLGVEAGTLLPGAPADVVVVDPAREWTVEPTRMRSRSHNTPFVGWRLRGRVGCVLVGGRVVLEREEAGA